MKPFVFLRHTWNKGLIWKLFWWFILMMISWRCHKSPLLAPQITWQNSWQLWPHLAAASPHLQQLRQRQKINYLLLTFTVQTTTTLRALDNSWPPIWKLKTKNIFFWFWDSGNPALLKLDLLLILHLEVSLNGFASRFKRPLLKG